MVGGGGGGGCGLEVVEVVVVDGCRGWREDRGAV